MVVGTAHPNDLEFLEMATWSCTECETGNGSDDLVCRTCMTPALGAQSGTPGGTGTPRPERPGGRGAGGGGTPMSAPIVFSVALALVGAAAYVTFGDEVTTPAMSGTGPATAPDREAAPVEPEPEPVPTGDATSWTQPPGEPDGDGGMVEPAEPEATVATPETIGLVQIEAAAATDPRAVEVARMFDTYFSGINDKDYDSVGTVLDPTGVVDPTSRKEMAVLARGTATTQDSDISLVSIRGDYGDPVRAEVHFRSTQAAGQGPRGRTGETCTRWAVDYALSDYAGSGYGIVRGDAEHAPC